MSSDEPLLRVEGLEKEYTTHDGFLDRLLGNGETIRAVDGVDLEIREGETLGLVGESGCGKSSLARSLLGLTEPTAGSVSYRGTDLTELSRSELRSMRTNVQYVAQHPDSSLNPRLTVADALREPLAVHDIVPPEDRDRRVRELLETVGLEASHAARYPHEFSGGQQQRVAIARALAVEPELLVCDEPVSALDVSVQAQLCNLLADLRDEFGLSYLFIAHDLSVVEHLADRVAVMYLGRIVEVGPTEAVFEGASHPYTEALRSAIPEPDPRWDGDRIVLEGSVPSPGDPPPGCRFHPRCPKPLSPAEFDLEPETVRAILSLRSRLADVADGDGSGDGNGDALESLSIDPAATAAVPTAIRSAFDIPRELGDEDADAVLAAALEAVAAGDVAAGRERLATAFASPCETDRPRLEGGALRAPDGPSGERRDPRVEGGEGDGDDDSDEDGRRAIACHRFDEQFADHRGTEREEARDRR